MNGVKESKYLMERLLVERAMNVIRRESLRLISSTESSKGYTNGKENECEMRKANVRGE